MSEIRITDPKNKAESHVFQNHQRRKRAEIICAVKYCQENNCKGRPCLLEVVDEICRDIEYPYFKYGQIFPFNHNIIFVGD